MRPNPDGSFEVSPSENITVTVTKSLYPYLATISDLDCECWASANKPDELTEVRAFTASATICTWCTFAIVFDFLKDSEGNYGASDNYTVLIKGDSGPAGQDVVHPPPPKTRTYRFHVSKP